MATLRERIPSPTGVVRGPLIDTKIVLERFEGVIGKPILKLVESLFAGVDLKPLHLFFAAEGFS